MGKGVAVVVGGSVAGLACAHAVAEVGWEVVVVEKAAAPEAGGGTGAGLGLDAQSMETLSHWVPGWGLDVVTLPLAIDLNRATDSETKASRTLTRDEGFHFRAAHWGDLHRRLHEALPAAVTVLWGHQFLSFEVSDDGERGVVATARVLRTGETVEVTGDLLVGADGCTSSIRRCFLPDLKLSCSFARACWDHICPNRMMRGSALDSLENIKDCLNYQFFMEITTLVYWSIWIMRSNKVSEHIDPTLQRWKDKLKFEFAMVIHRAKKKYFPSTLDR